MLISAVRRLIVALDLVFELLEHDSRWEQQLGKGLELLVCCVLESSRGLLLWKLSIVKANGRSL
jgi:hypothetical protein